MRQIGKKGQRWQTYRKKYIKDKKNFEGYFTCNHCKGWFTNIEVDHIIPRSARPDLVFESSNLQLLCGGCHTKKTREQSG